MTTGAKVGKITCKACGVVFQNVKEYLACDGCEKEDCPMGRRWKARQAANEAITNAQHSSAQKSDGEKQPKFICHVRTCHMESEVDDSLPIREKEMSHCIAFHIMKQ